MSELKYVVLTPFTGRCQAVVVVHEDGTEAIKGSSLKVKAYLTRYAAKGARVVDQAELDGLHQAWDSSNDVGKTEIPGAK